MYSVDMMKLSEKVSLAILFFLFAFATGYTRLTTRLQSSYQISSQLQQQGTLLEQYTRMRSAIMPLITAGRIADAAKIVDTKSPNRRVKTAIASFIGQQIFSREGIGGITECFTIVGYDENFGCIHGVLSAAVHRGESFFGVMYQQCLALQKEGVAQMCVHNIGHALAANYGYTSEGLKRASEDCRHFPDPGSGGIDACSSGVYMEYYLARLNADGKGITSQIVKDKMLQFDPDHPYDICPTVADSEYCYSQIVHWWLGDVKLTRQRVGELCIAISDERSAHVCIMSLSEYPYAQLEGLLMKFVGANENNTASCASTHDYAERLDCYKRQLVKPKSTFITDQIESLCASLQIGSYATTCEDFMKERVSQFDYRV